LITIISFVFWYHLVSSFTTTATPPITHTGPQIPYPQEPRVRLWVLGIGFFGLGIAPWTSPHAACVVLFCCMAKKNQKQKKTKAEMNTSRGEKVKRPEMKLREGSTQSAIITLRKVISKKSNV